MADFARDRGFESGSLRSQDVLAKAVEGYVDQRRQHENDVAGGESGQYKGNPCRNVALGQKLGKMSLYAKPNPRSPRYHRPGSRIEKKSSTPTYKSAGFAINRRAHPSACCVKGTRSKRCSATASGIETVKSRRYVG
jgi:hypothetical protein